MPRSEPDPDPVVLRLAPIRFTAQQAIEAARITPDVLTNYKSKVRLQLVSSSPGQGKPHEYLLIDVQILALVAEFTKLTGNAQWAARAIENLVFFEVFKADNDFRVGGVPRTPEQTEYHRALVRARIAEDITTANPIFWRNRDFGSIHPLAIADRGSVGTAHQIINIMTDLRDVWGQGSAGYFVDVFAVFSVLESTLAYRVGIRDGGDVRLHDRLETKSEEDAA